MNESGGKIHANVHAGKSILLFIAGTQIEYISNFPIRCVPPSVSCQSRLQECLRERAELLQVQEAANKQREKEKREYKRGREAWDRRCKELESDITRLQEELKQSQEKIEEIERKQKVVYKEGQITGERLFDLISLTCYHLNTFFLWICAPEKKNSIKSWDCSFKGINVKYFHMDSLLSFRMN